MRMSGPRIVCCKIEHIAKPIPVFTYLAMTVTIWVYVSLTQYNFLNFNPVQVGPRFHCFAIPRS